MVGNCKSFPMERFYVCVLVALKEKLVAVRKSCHCLNFVLKADQANSGKRAILFGLSS